jgi:hypothetical protein
MEVMKMAGYKPHPNAQNRIESAKRAIKVILDFRMELQPEHVRAFVYRGLTLLTVAEATGKEMAQRRATEAPREGG